MQSLAVKLLCRQQIVSVPLWFQSKMCTTTYSRVGVN